MDKKRLIGVLVVFLFILAIGNSCLDTILAQSEPSEVLNATSSNEYPLLLLGKDIRSEEVQAYLSSLRKESEVRIISHGKNIKSEEVQAYLSSLGKEGTVKASYLYDYKDIGISLEFLDGILTSIFYNSSLQKEFKQYQGKLPRGFSFLDTREEVEKRIGPPPPEKPWFISDIKVFWVQYPKLGIQIVYSASSASDMSAQISGIWFYIPE